MKKVQKEAEAQTVDEEITQAQETAEETAAAVTEPRVYCGPSVRGVARQYTVYSGELPDILTAFVDEHPTVKALIVPTSEFAHTRRMLETKGTAQALIYQQVRSEL